MENKIVYVVLNPVAGHASAEQIQSALETAFNALQWTYEIYQTTGEEDIAELTRQACQQGANLVIAAGGDGTVGGAVNGLVHSGIPLGILPVGTGNGLARALQIPVDVQAAVDLITGDHQLLTIDAMQVGEHYFVLNVSAGISARAMEKTPAPVKRRFGFAAYIWTVVSEALGFRPRRFRLNLDGMLMQVRASEVLVSNGELLKEAPFPLGPRERFNDGIFDVYIISAHSALDYIRLLWETILSPQKSNGSLKNLSIERSIHIDTVHQPQPVQGDGEVIGQTPVEVKLVKDAVQVIVPEKGE